MDLKMLYSKTQSLLLLLLLLLFFSLFSLYFPSVSGAEICFFQMIPSCLQIQITEM